MRAARTFASIAAVPVLLAWPALAVADIEEIAIEGHTYDFVRLSFEEIRQQIGSFNADLEYRNLPGRIAQCSSGLDLSAGQASGGHGIGAYCILKTDATVLTVRICSSRPSGRFGMEAIDLTSASKSGLAIFVQRNCSGG